MTSPYLDRPLRSLEQAREDLRRKRSRNGSDAPEREPTAGTRRRRLGRPEHRNRPADGSGTVPGGEPRPRD